MPKLYAIDLPQGPALMEAIADLWDAGHAVSVLDPRWGSSARSNALTALQATKLIDRDGTISDLDGMASDPGDALVVLTSGSLASPKAAVLTMEAVTASAHATSTALNVDPARHRWLCCLPTSHIGGLSVIARAIVTATPCTVIERPEPEALARESRRGATHVSLVATVLSRIDSSLFERIVIGGAAPPGHVDANVVCTYGMTETGSGVVYDGVTLPGVEITIEEPDAAGVGEILVRTPTALRSYRDRPAPFVRGPDGSDEWLATGDAGRLNDVGLLEVRGRLAEVIVTGSEKVFPGDVEHIITAMPGVGEVAVWKRPDPVWGERVVAWVVPSEDGPPSLDAIRARVREELAPYAAPRELEIVHELPRTAIGKLQRRALN